MGVRTIPGHKDSLFAQGYQECPDLLLLLVFYNGFGQAFNIVFQQFKATTLVSNVLGTGPIPTFAPPIVPVGPVVGGVATGAPGFLK